MTEKKMPTRSYESKGLQGLRSCLQSGEWTSWETGDLITLIGHIEGHAELKTNDYVVRLIQHVFTVCEKTIALARAFDLACEHVNGKNMLAEVFFIETAKFAELAQLRHRELHQIFNGCADLVVMRARKAMPQEQQLVLQNLKLLGELLDEDCGLPRTAACVSALSQRLQHRSDLQSALHGLPEHLAQTIVAASAKVASFSQLQAELRRFAQALMREEKADGRKYFYEHHVMHRVFSNCLNVVLTGRGTPGAALAYHLRKASKVMVNPLIAGEDALDSETIMVMMDPIETAPAEIAAELEALRQSGRLIEPQIALDFAFAF
ncbi:MAG: hypothetical protein ACRD3W_24165, partial [Terriglobales bacterium]